MTFKGYEDAIIFCFHFYFLFRTNGKRTWYFFFESTVLKLLDHSYQSWFATITLTTAFETTHYTVEDFMDMDQ